MQERGNKFKPISKKEVPLPINISEDTTVTQESRLSSNSQNKLFIRKPVSKRNGFVSPSFTKNRGAQNEEITSPDVQTKGKKCIQNDSRSNQDYWDSKQSMQFSTKLALRKYISTQQAQKLQPFKKMNGYHVNEAYMVDETHALTQVGENYKQQIIELESSQKDSYSVQNIKRNSKQNIICTSRNINAKKVSRTEYFANPKTEEIRSTTSRSLKQKQLNFSLLRQSANNNVENYIFTLQDNIRKLEKDNYTLIKKCKWMHQEVQMHLEKEHLVNAEKKGFQVEIKTKQDQIEKLSQENSRLKTQIDELKTQLENKEPLKKYKSFKDISTISSMKQYSSKNQGAISGKVNKIQENLQGYFGIVPSSNQKNKKKSFRTYPGIFSPRKSRQNDSKSSSIIIGNNQFFQDFGQTSLNNQKMNNKNSQNEIKNLAMIEELKKQRDELKSSLESLTIDIDLLKEKNTQNLNTKSQEYEKKLCEHSNKIGQLQSDLDILQGQKETLLIELDKIHADYQAEIQTLKAQIKDLERQVHIQSKSSISADDTIFQEENPLKYLFKNTQKNDNFKQSSDIEHLEHENKSLRVYIQRLMEHYKYVKIENRMLLRVKEDKEKLEKEKKQIKDQRDSFKKKLLDLLKNKSQSAKKSTKSCKRLMDFESQSSQEEDSAVFELSQSQIKLNDENKYEKVEN